MLARLNHPRQNKGYMKPFQVLATNLLIFGRQLEFIIVHSFYNSDIISMILIGFTAANEKGTNEEDFLIYKKLQ